LSFLRKQESRKKAWKLKIIEKESPYWVDLCESICGWSWIPASAGMTFSPGFLLLATCYPLSRVQASQAQALKEWHSVKKVLIFSTKWEMIHFYL